eukprot:g17628.t1
MPSLLVSSDQQPIGCSIGAAGFPFPPQAAAGAAPGGIVPAQVDSSVPHPNNFLVHRSVSVGPRLQRVAQPGQPRHLAAGGGASPPPVRLLGASFTSASGGGGGGFLGRSCGSSSTQHQLHHDVQVQQTRLPQSRKEREPVSVNKMTYNAHHQNNKSKTFMPKERKGVGKTSATSDSERILANKMSGQSPSSSPLFSHRQSPAKPAASSKSPIRFGRPDLGDNFHHRGQQLLTTGGSARSSTVTQPPPESHYHNTGGSGMQRDSSALRQSAAPSASSSRIVHAPVGLAVPDIHAPVRIRALRREIVDADVATKRERVEELVAVFEDKDGRREQLAVSVRGKVDQTMWYRTELRGIKIDNQQLAND